VITGEADLKFAEVCGQLVAGGRPPAKIIPAEPPDFSRLVLPYECYDAHDVAHRIIYLEASRGCPFTCEFCLSALDIPVRQAPLPALLEHLERLLERGARHFKFVDRTFNLNVATSRKLLEFLLERCQPGCFFHFEMVPDQLPETLREVIAQFPRGALQMEVGVQTFNEEVGARISRRQNYRRLEDNLHFLRRHTGVHVHADLIAGLPGETLESFAAGFDRLVALGPQEIQVGILKRLRGAPIGRHDAQWQMVYNPHPPYEVLQNKLLDFATLQQVRRFARYWDLVGNSGNFLETAPLIWGAAGKAVPAAAAAGASLGQAGETPRELAGEEAGATHSEARRSAPSPRSPFQGFLRWSQWLHGRVGRTDSIALLRLMELLFEFLTDELRLDPKAVAEPMWRDYQRGGRRDKPAFLKDYPPAQPPRAAPPRPGLAVPKRQARHLV
jgi:hypothetical protein